MASKEEFLEELNRKVNELAKLIDVDSASDRIELIELGHGLIVFGLTLMSKTTEDLGDLLISLESMFEDFFKRYGKEYVR